MSVERHPQEQSGPPGRLLDRNCSYEIISSDFKGSNHMKKTYEKPVFVRKGKLSMVVASLSLANGAA
jgi:hypothetical protein